EANPIPESNFRDISNFRGAGQERAWRGSDRTDHSRASAAPVRLPEKSAVPRRPTWSYIGRIATRLLPFSESRRETPRFQLRRPVLSPKRVGWQRNMAEIHFSAETKKLTRDIRAVGDCGNPDGLRICARLPVGGFLLPGPAGFRSPTRS